MCHAVALSYLLTHRMWSVSYFFKFCNIVSTYPYKYVSRLKSANFICKVNHSLWLCNCSLNLVMILDSVSLSFHKAVTCCIYGLNTTHLLKILCRSLRIYFHDNPCGTTFYNLLPCLIVQSFKLCKWLDYHPTPNISRPDLWNLWVKCRNDAKIVELVH